MFGTAHTYEKWFKILDNMAASQTIRGIANSWIRKGDAEANIFNKFICYWIAFNCFYNSWTGKDTDAKAITALTTDQMLTQTFRATINGNTIPLYNRLRAVCPIRKVSDPAKFKTISSISNFSQVTRVLYQVRCNLVHGGKGEEIVRDRDVVKAATPVLELVVKELVRRHF